MTSDHFDILREDIATLRQDITSRLDRLNGSVTRHSSEIAVLQSVAHPGNSCEILEEILGDVATLKENAATTKRVWKIAASVAGAAVTIAAVVLEFVLR